MIPLQSIFESAAKSPVVRRVAVGVIVVAVALYGVKLVFGSDVRVTTTDATQCSISLADKSARLELTEKALTSCSRAIDLCTGAPR